MSRFLFLVMVSLLVISCQVSGENQEYDMDNVQVIVTSIRRIQVEGGSGNFVIFLVDKESNYYIQFAGNRGESELHAEAVSNQFLDPKFALTEDQITLLETIGWDPPSAARPNFYRDYEASTDSERQIIAGEVLRTMTEVYGLDPLESVIVELVLE